MLSDYISLTKPRLMPLLNLSAVCSAIAASGQFPLLTIAVLLVAGSLATGGSSAINCYIERDLDSKMERTKKRPLPLKSINPPIKAAFFGITLLTISLFLSLHFLNIQSTFFIFLGAFFYIVVYTKWLKRRYPGLNIIIGGFAIVLTPVVLFWLVLLMQVYFLVRSERLFMTMTLAIQNSSFIFSCARCRDRFEALFQLPGSLIWLCALITARFSRNFVR